MTSSRDDAACSPAAATEVGVDRVAQRDIRLAAGAARPWAALAAEHQGSLPDAAVPLSADGGITVQPLPDGQQDDWLGGHIGDDAAEPLTETGAEEQIHGICFKTGPPSQLGVELEWLVRDGRDPALPVDSHRVTQALAGLGVPGALPGCGRLTTEPGGQIELSSAPAVGLAACITTTCQDLSAIREAMRPAGLYLTGEGIDPLRTPRRVLDQPRYAAMEEFFNRSGPWGQIMMCTTASVQVCVDAGEEGSGAISFGWRWRLLHALGPVLIAAFANSPLRCGRPTGWKSTRQAVWARIDPTRTRAPAHAEPTAWASAGKEAASEPDHRNAWVEYALAAEVICVRRPGDRTWLAPPGLTFRDWLRGGAERPPTLGDLTYHLSTLFPPVRPRGHMEVRVIDAQPGDGWIVPAAVVAALLGDPVAGEEAMAATETLGTNGSPTLRAARLGMSDPAIAAAALRCFTAAQAGLERLGAAPYLRQAVAAFTERYVARGRCPADDRLDEARDGLPWGGLADMAEPVGGMEI